MTVLVVGEGNMKVPCVVVRVARGDSSPKMKNILKERLSKNATTETKTGVVDGATAATVADIMMRNKLSSLVAERGCCCVLVALVQGF
mmetsp:Transcript_10889/g.22167  ORF Transcript_10889/g.22167 Transcript_10889/m.22167 type:complete len:88 (+) Transcript_10889:99-362(+)